MASSDRLYLASVDGERFETTARTAKRLKEVWLSQRQQQLAMQLIANAEVRKRWIEAEPMETRGQRAKSDAILF